MQDGSPQLCGELGIPQLERGIMRGIMTCLGSIGSCKVVWQTLVCQTQRPTEPRSVLSAGKAAPDVNIIESFFSALGIWNISPSPLQANRPGWRLVNKPPSAMLSSKKDECMLQTEFLSMQRIKDAPPFPWIYTHQHDRNAPNTFQEKVQPCPTHGHAGLVSLPKLPTLLLPSS